MPSVREQIARNVHTVQDRIVQAAGRVGRDPSTVRLIPVTKTVGLPEIRVLYEIGFREFGESRVQNAIDKIRQAEDSGLDARWHMVGNVQSRKARDVVRWFERVDSVDRVRLAAALDKHCEAAGKRMSILLQVNVSGETAKHGFAPDELPGAIEQVRSYTGLRIEGLMTMAPFVENAEEVRPVFARLRRLAEENGLQELSMGMTNDFEVAVEEGATEVRIGTALFQ